MDFGSFASQTFRLFLLPPASLFVILAFGWTLHRRLPLVSKLIVRSVLLVSFILCTPAGANLLVAPLENLTVPLLGPATVRAGAIVILAAGRHGNAAEYGGIDIPDYIALARLRYGAHLQHETGLPILVSGGNRAGIAPFETKAFDMAYALRNDFKTPVTWVEGNSETTAENASRSIVILHAAGVEQILLVTDAMHMPRAQQVFRQSGMHVTPAPTMFFRLDHYDVGSFVPSAEGLRRSYYALYEWIGLGWYNLGGAGT